MSASPIRLGVLVGGLLVTTSLPVSGQTPQEILERIDANVTSDTKRVSSRMIVHSRRGDRTVESVSVQRGLKDSFTEYLNPPRERGTKMLKLDDRLWTYSPETDRTVTISGHMLRQSVMGSDLSYEDMMEDPLLQNTYSATIAGEEEFLDRPVWKLDLEAKVDGLAYERRAIWVDQERYLPLKEERYARSGRLLKTAEVREVKQFDGRWVASSALFVDALRDGEGTEFIVDDIEFDVEVPDHVFSRASLRR